MKRSKDTLYKNSPDRPVIKSKHLQPNIPTTYLGVTSQVNGEQLAQTNELCAKVKKINCKLCCSYLLHYYGHIYQQCVSNLKLSYQLVYSSTVAISTKILKTFDQMDPFDKDRWEAEKSIFR